MCRCSFVLHFCPAHLSCPGADACAETALSCSPCMVTHQHRQWQVACGLLEVDVAKLVCGPRTGTQRNNCSNHATTALQQESTAETMLNSSTTAWWEVSSNSRQGYKLPGALRSMSFRQRHKESGRLCLCCQHNQQENRSRVTQQTETVVPGPLQT